METIKSGQEKVKKMIEASDISVDPESNLAVVMIKPNAFKNRGLIIQRLKDSGLYVVKTVAKQLPENFVIGAMLDNTPEKGLQEETLKHLESGPSEIILLKGDDLLKKIILLTGENTDPNKCSKESIRYLFGEHEVTETKDGSFHANAVHRPKTEEERTGDLEKFRQIIP